HSVLRIFWYVLVQAFCADMRYSLALIIPKTASMPRLFRRFLFIQQALGIGCIYFSGLGSATRKKASSCAENSLSSLVS
ncbi:MAG: hypothetical protein MSC43_00585, partial [Clostridiales bacterium]|nr:hypothetical protein [Clostridiales bacterium]